MRTFSSNSSTRLQRNARQRIVRVAVALALALASCAGTGATAGVPETAAPRISLESFRTSDGVELPMRDWLPAEEPRAVILALHGFGDYSASFARPAEYWAEHGVATFAFDQRGFGGAPHTFQWAGVAAMSADARQAVHALRSTYPGIPLYLLGESMGGALAIATTTGPDPAEADGTVLVSPAVWEHDMLGTIERSALWVTNLTMPDLWLEPPRGLVIHPSDNVAMLRGLSRDSLVQKGARAGTTFGLMDLMDRAGEAVSRLTKPTLVLFGAHEEVLPPDAVSMLLGRLPAANVRVAVYPNGYHMLLRDLDGDVVSRDILTWVLDRGEALPSGDECKGPAAGSAPCRKGG